MRVCEANVRVRNVMTKASLRPDVRQKKQKNKQAKGVRETGEKPFPTTERERRREGALPLSPRYRDSPIASGKQTIKQPARARLIPQLDHVDNSRPSPLITKLNRHACLTHAFHTIGEDNRRNKHRLLLRVRLDDELLDICRALEVQPQLRSAQVLPLLMLLLQEDFTAHLRGDGGSNRPGVDGRPRGRKVVFVRRGSSWPPMLRRHPCHTRRERCSRVKTGPVAVAVYRRPKTIRGWEHGGRTEVSWRR